MAAPSVADAPSISLSCGEMSAVVAPLSMRKSTNPASPTSRVTTTYPARGFPGIPTSCRRGNVTVPLSFSPHALARALASSSFSNRSLELTPRDASLTLMFLARMDMARRMRLAGERGSSSGSEGAASSSSFSARRRRVPKRLRLLRYAMRRVAAPRPREGPGTAPRVAMDVAITADGIQAVRTPRPSNPKCGWLSRIEPTKHVDLTGKRVFAPSQPSVIRRVLPQAGRTDDAHRRTRGRVRVAGADPSPRRRRRSRAFDRFTRVRPVRARSKPGRQSGQSRQSAPSRSRPARVHRHGPALRHPSAALGG